MEQVILLISDYWQSILVILGFFGIAVDCTPWIKVNPVKAIFSYIGKAINKDVIDRIDGLQTQVDNLDKRLDEQEEKSKQYRMTSLHDRIFQMHRYFMHNGKISRADLENFHMCVEEYEINGGNGTVKNKIVPEVDALPIDYKGCVEPFDERKAEAI